MKEALVIKDKLDSLYNDVLNGVQDIFKDSDSLMLDILKLKRLNIVDEDEQKNVDDLIHSFIDKINLNNLNKQ